MDKALRDPPGDVAAAALAAARAEPLWPRSPRWMVLVGVLAAAFLLAFPWVFTDRFSQHLMIMVGSVILWWPVLSPSAELPRAPYPVQML